MAESESGADRSEAPSQKRVQEAREHGQLPRSRELSNFATMIGGSATLIAIGPLVKSPRRAPPATATAPFGAAEFAR